ncbi:MAG: hypothetical protein J6Q21_04375 [Alistipes sp.]|nr:hypothetical protein [Alistipes sp.]
MKKMMFLSLVFSVMALGSAVANDANAVANRKPKGVHLSINVPSVGLHICNERPCPPPPPHKCDGHIAKKHAKKHAKGHAPCPHHKHHGHGNFSPKHRPAPAHGGRPGEAFVARPNHGGHGGHNHEAPRPGNHNGARGNR